VTLKTVLLLAILATAGSAAVAFAVERPELNVGDNWSYKRVDLNSNQVSGSFLQEITEKAGDGYELRVEGQGIFVQASALTRNLGRVVEIAGKKSDSNWLDFPLTPGKSWKAKDDWKNQFGSIGYDEIAYTVEGEEEVKVEAGTFKAVKISGSGWWNNSSNNASGSVVVNLWYAPEAKAIVRYQRNNYFKNGTRSNDVIDLVRYSIK
jgi:hypothetical protein